MATPAKEWRRVETVKLPSGKEADLRKPSVLSLVGEGGDVPDALTDQILTSMNRKKGDKTERKPLVITRESLPQFLGFVNQIVKASFAEPRIVETPNYEAGEISLADVDDEDKFFIMGWALPQEQAGQAERFPEQ